MLLLTLNKERNKEYILYFKSSFDSGELETALEIHPSVILHIQHPLFSKLLASVLLIVSEDNSIADYGLPPGLS